MIFTFFLGLFIGMAITCLISAKNIFDLLSVIEERNLEISELKNLH